MLTALPTLTTACLCVTLQLASARLYSQYVHAIHKRSCESLNDKLKHSEPPGPQYPLLTDLQWLEGDKQCAFTFCFTDVGLLLRRS